MKIKQT